MFSYILTDEMKKNGVQTMTTEYAWKYEYAIEVIDYLYSKEYVILGGDVLNDDFEYTCSNWYYENKNKISISDAIKESAQKAKTYLEWYHNKFGNDFYYIIVATKKMDYMLMNEAVFYKK